MLDASLLAAMREVEISKVDKSTLVDISSIQLDASLPVAQRVQQFVELVKNPYAFRVGEVGVKVEYTPGGKTLKDAITSYLTTIKNNE